MYSDLELEVVYCEFSTLKSFVDYDNIILVHFLIFQLLLVVVSLLLLLSSSLFIIIISSIISIIIILICYVIASDVAANKKNQPNAGPIKMRSFAKKMDDESLYYI